MFRDQKEKNLYIQAVWEELESRYLQSYPFLTESEFRDLFGERVIKLIENLDCHKEGCGQCDLEIDCPY